MLVTRQLLVAIDFHCIFFHMEVNNGYHQLFGYIFLNIFLCTTEKRNSYRFGMTWGWVHFWVKYPFNLLTITYFSNHPKLDIIWKHKHLKLILWKLFCYHESATLNAFGRLLSLVSGVKCHVTKFTTIFYNQNFKKSWQNTSLERSES